MRVKRPKIGDVIEIDTGQGLAYAHFSHRHKQFGYLLRVYNKLYSERPVDLTATVADAPTFYQFFPLGAYVQRGVVTIVGQVPLTEEATVPPLFREGLFNPKSGKVDVWWIWNGEHSRRIGPPTDEIRVLSPLSVCNDIYLVECIVSGWTPERDPALVPNCV